MKSPENAKGKIGDGILRIRTAITSSARVTNFHEAAFLVLVGYTLLILLARTNADPDLWGHLRFGADILAKGRISQVDPYSFLTTGQRWINHEWLAEVAFAAAWIASGELGLVILKTVIGLLTFGLLYWHLRTQKMVPLRAATLLLIFSAALLPFLQNVRPQVFTYLLFAIFLIILYRADKGEYIWLWGIVPLVALWVNLHGAFLAAIGILVGWATLYLLQKREAWRQVLPPIILSLLAVTLNPYGKDLILFLIRTATVPRPEIEDWQPLRLISADGGVYLIVLAVSGVGIFFSRRPRRLASLAILLVTAVLPLTAIRHLPLFSISALVFAGEHIGDSWERLSPSRISPRSHPTALAVSLVLGFVALSVLAFSLHLENIHVKVGEYPVGAVDLLRQSQISGNIANEFDWGEYLIWHLGPQVKVSVDDRRETVYSEQIYRENIDFMDGTQRWNALLRQHPTDIALVYKEHLIYHLLMKDPDWTLVYQDNLSALFAERNSPVLIPLRRATSNFDSRTLTNEDSFP